MSEIGIGSLVASLGLDTRNFDMAVQRAEQRMERASREIGSKMHRIGEKWQDVGKSMQKTGKKMSMYMTLPLAGFGALALRTAGNFEASMNKVGAISQATGSELEALERKARDLGGTTQFSASQAADAMSYLAMAGFEVNEVMDAMQQH